MATERDPPPEGVPERPYKATVTPLKPPDTAKPKRAPLDWSRLAGLEPPERRWAIKGWLGFGHVTLMVGSGGIGKTLLAQQMASCLALGKPFIGDIPEPLTCLMWACEDDHDELWRRQVALARWCNVGLEAFAGGLVIVPRHGLDNAIAVSDFGNVAFTPRLAELEEQANDLRADVVILDNAGQVYGAGENDRHAVTAFLNALSGALPGRALLLLAHPSRSSGSEFSGSSAWENVTRTRLYLGATLPGEKPDEEPADDVRYLARRKANYSPRDWRRMTYAEGALTVEEQAGGMVEKIKAGRAERAILAALQKLATMGLHGTHGKRSANFLPKMMAEYHLDEGIASRELTAAMRALMVDGRIKTEKIGTSQNRHPIIGLIECEL